MPGLTTSFLLPKHSAGSTGNIQIIHIFLNVATRFATETFHSFIYQLLEYELKLKEEPKKLKWRNGFGKGKAENLLFCPGETFTDPKVSKASRRFFPGAEQCWAPCSLPPGRDKCQIYHHHIWQKASPPKFCPNHFFSSDWHGLVIWKSLVVYFLSCYTLYSSGLKLDAFQPEPHTTGFLFQSSQTPLSPFHSCFTSPLLPWLLQANCKTETVYLHTSPKLQLIKYFATKYTFLYSVGRTVTHTCTHKKIKLAPNAHLTTSKIELLGNIKPWRKMCVMPGCQIRMPWIDWICAWLASFSKCNFSPTTWVIVLHESCKRTQFPQWVLGL